MNDYSGLCERDPGGSRSVGFVTGVYAALILGVLSLAWLVALAWFFLKFIGLGPEQ